MGILDHSIQELMITSPPKCINVPDLRKFLDRTLPPGKPT
jgi:hypothetical protein